MIDVKQAMLDPTSVFKDPTEVVLDENLSRDQKIEILRRWEYDAHQLAVAEEKAGMAVHRPDMFDRVLQALHALGVERDTEHTPPTKLAFRFAAPAGVPMSLPGPERRPD